MKRLVKWLIVCGTVAIALVVYSYVSQHQKFWYAGTLETTKVIVAAKVNTDILTIAHEEGEMVKEGELIAQLNDDSYQVAAPRIKAEYLRFKELYQQGAATKEAFEAAEQAYKDNELKIAWCQVKAPLSGMIITKYKEAGEYVNAGAGLVSITDPYDIWAYFYVPYDVVHSLKVGSKVVGKLPEMPDVEFVGTIIKINEEAEFTPKNVQTRDERTRLVYGVKVKFANAKLDLKAGMTIETTLDAE